MKRITEWVNLVAALVRLGTALFFALAVTGSTPLGSGHCVLEHVHLSSPIQPG